MVIYFFAWLDLQRGLSEPILKLVYMVQSA